jgi:hypothetical protein
MYLKQKDIIAVAICSFVYFLLCVGSAMVLGELDRLIVLPSSLFIVLTVVFELYRRLDVVQRDLYDDVIQLDPLLSVHAMLRLTQPLPAMRGHAMAPDAAVIMISLIRELRPRTIVETGSGVSTLVMGYCLKQLGEGRVVALDHDVSYAEHTDAQVRRHGLTEYATVQYAPLAPVQVHGETHNWYALDRLGGVSAIDLVFDDGPPLGAGAGLRYAALPLLLDKMSERAVYVVNYVGDEERANLERWLARYRFLTAETLPTRKGMLVLRRSAGPQHAVANAQRR